MEHDGKLQYIPNAFHTVVLIAFQTNFKKAAPCRRDGLK